MGIISIGIRNRASVRSRLDVDSVHSLSQAREKFIRNGSRHLRNLLWAKRMTVMSAIEQNFGANVCVGNVSEVNLHLVHADAPDDWRGPAFYQHLACAGKLPAGGVNRGAIVSEL